MESGNASSRKRSAGESVDADRFKYLTQNNFEEFLQTRRLEFREEKLKEIWEKLRSQFGEKLEKVIYILSFS